MLGLCKLDFVPCLSIYLIYFFVTIQILVKGNFGGKGKGWKFKGQVGIRDSGFGNWGADARLFDACGCGGEQPALSESRSVVEPSPNTGRTIASQT